MQYRMPENYELVKEALLKAGRDDLIGFDKHCLIPPRKFKTEHEKNVRHEKKDQHRKPKQTSGGHKRAERKNGSKNDRKFSNDNSLRKEQTRKKR